MQATPKKLVLADYFLGFSTRSVSGGARPWRLYYESEEDAARGVPPRCDAAFSGDLYLNGDIKDIASTYYPAIGPYDTADPIVAEYHVLLAKAAGIDGFMCEFTIGQEDKLLNLVAAAKKHDFGIGVNWINQSHLGENVWRDRAEAIDRAHEVVRWLAKQVYQPCGVRLDGRYLLLIFLAHPRQPNAPFDRFFSPGEVAALKSTALDAGMDAQFLVLPWEPLAQRPSSDTTPTRVWDGLFPWVWSSSGAAATSAESGWSRVTTRAQYLKRLSDYYAMAERARRDGQIGTYIGAVCPGFDDHKGQAWGEGLKRSLPRDGGQTLRDTWTELKKAKVSAALIITWNDWVESSQIEPSLELGHEELAECARQTAAWKQSLPPSMELLGQPWRLYDARRRSQKVSRAGVQGTVSAALDEAARLIAHRQEAEAAALLQQAAHDLDRLEAQIGRHEVHLFWELGFDAAGIECTGAHAHGGVGFVVTENVRGLLQRSLFEGRLCFEYFDVGIDFIRVVVDAPEEGRQIIASFKKANSGRWQKASVELVNARFVRGLGGSDFRIVQSSSGASAVRMVRLDGACLWARAASP